MLTGLNSSAFAGLNVNRVKQLRFCRVKFSFFVGLTSCFFHRVKKKFAGLNSRGGRSFILLQQLVVGDAAKINSIIGFFFYIFRSFMLFVGLNICAFVGLNSYVRFTGLNFCGGRKYNFITVTISGLNFRMLW